MKKKQKALAEAPEAVTAAIDYSTEGLEAVTGEREADLFSFVEYKPEEAERIGYSEYSYWKSVWKSFLKKKSAVVMLVIFLAVFIFSFIAISPLCTDYNHYSELKSNRSTKFASPSSEFWFGADNIGRDYWYQC